MSQQVIFLVLRRMRRPLIALILVYAVASFGLTLISGVDPDGNPWRMSFFHAFYFVSFMGSTIGFGEIPHPFTDPQRYWVLAFIYITVVVWLYTIGTMLSLVQDPAFKQAVTNQRFSRNVRQLRDPFYIICGYGDTGRTLTKDLTLLGYTVVVLDQDNDNLSDIPLHDFNSPVHSLMCDMTIPENLLHAGLMSPNCLAIIALSDNDHANLKVAVSSKSLNPSLVTVCRASDKNEIANLRSFHTDIVINPNQLFASRLNHAMENPSAETIVRWLISQNYENTPNIRETTPVPRGKWIICGYGKFGKAIKSQLDAHNIQNTVIAENDLSHKLPEDYIEGNGTEAHTLEKAGIHDSVGVIAGTNDDANNLSIILTAQQIKNTLFTVGRLNQHYNDAVYSGAQPDMVYRDNTVMANAILTRLTRPMVTSFIHELGKYSSKKTDQILTEIKQLDKSNALITWRITINQEQAPTITSAIESGTEITLDLLTKPLASYNQIKCLMVHRRGHKDIAPTTDLGLEIGDKLLFCGTQQAATKQRWISQNIELFESELDPGFHDIPLLRWLTRTGIMKPKS